MLDQILQNHRTIDWLEGKSPELFVEPATREMLYGCLRYLPGLTQLCHTFLDKPLKAKDSIVWSILLVGAYQLKFMSVPDHAAINETVAAVRHLRRPWATGLVNAILRKISETEHSFEPSGQFPNALKDQLATQYPDQAERLYAALLARAPMTLRVNALRTDSDAYKAQLNAADLDYRPGWFPECLALTTPIPSHRLPGFQEGDVAIQDAAAQWAYHILFDSEDMQSSSCKILDACSAPGGKLFHILEQLGPATEITALEFEPRRAKTIEQIGQRLGHTIQPMIGDARTQDWWDEVTFSHILLDAPCSGTGTIRRHPDIKYLFELETLKSHCETQLAMLNNLWPMLQAGGSLLYCTCSLLEQENDQVIEAFVKQQESEHQPRFIPEISSLELPTGQPTQHGWQLLPTDPMTDGFYFSLLKKPKSAR